MRSSAGQQLLQLRNRLGGRKSASDSTAAAAVDVDEQSRSATRSPINPSDSLASVDITTATAAEGTETIISERKQIVLPPVDDAPAPAVGPSAVTSAPTKKSGRSSKKSKPTRPSPVKHHRQQSSSSTSKTKSKSKSGRRIRPGRGGPGKEGRARRRKRRDEKAEIVGLGSSFASVFAGKGGSAASVSSGGTDGRSVVPGGEATGGYSAAATAAGGTAGSSSAWTTHGIAPLPPPIGLEKNRTYSDHTQVTGTGTLTTAVSTRQATVEGMSHHDGQSNSELLTCEMASVSLGLDDPCPDNNSALGLEGGLQLDELGEIDEDGNPTLAIHTFPCRGRSLEAPAPFDERGADAMRRYRQHDDEDEYLTDESSEVVVPLHWPKARRPSQGGKTQLGFSVIEADADYYDENEEEGQEQDDDVKPAAVFHQDQQDDEEEVTGEEIEVEVQDTEAPIITTNTATAKFTTECRTSAADTTAAAAAAVKDGAPSTAAADTTASLFGRPPLRLPPLNISIGRGGDKTPTDHAFSAAVVTPEHRRVESIPSLLGIGSTSADAEGADDVLLRTVSQANDDDDDEEGKDVLVDDNDNISVQTPKEEDQLIIARTPSNGSDSTPSGLIPFSPPLPTRTASFPNLHTRTASFPAIPAVPNPIPFVKAQSYGTHSAVSIGPKTSSAWKSWNAAVVAASAAVAVHVPRSAIATPSRMTLRGTPTMSDHGSIVHVHRPGSGDDAVSSPTSTAPSNKEERSVEVASEAVEVESTTMGKSPRKSSEDSSPSVEISTQSVVEIEEMPTKQFRSSPDGSTASTVKVRTFDASKIEEAEKRPTSMSRDDAGVPAVTSISFEISPEANRYLSPKLDDGKLYSEHPHDEAPSPSESTGAAVDSSSPTQRDIFRSGDVAEGDDSERSDFPKIVPSSSSGSHSLPAVLSPAYKFAPIDSPYYASDSESCSGEEEESTYENSESDCDDDNQVSKEGVEGDSSAASGTTDGNGGAAGKDDARKLSGTSQTQENPLDSSIGGQSGRYESFAKSGGGRALMRNLTQLDDSTASIVEEQIRPKRPSSNGPKRGMDTTATAAVAGSSRQETTQKGEVGREDDFAFSFSDIPSLLSQNISRCIGDIGNNIGDYYDAHNPNQPNRRQQRQPQQPKQPPKEK